MANGDLYYVRSNCSTSNRHWSFGFWLEEVDPLSAGGDGLTVAKAVDALLSLSLRGILCVAGELESWQASRRWTGPNAGGIVTLATGVGLRPGNPLPNDNAIYVNLQQIFGPAKHNGGFFIAGQSETDHSQSDWVTAYLNTEIKAFTDLLTQNFDAVSPETGRWRIVVVSKTIIPQTTPVGTPLDVTRAVAASRVLTQSRRRQKVVGFA